MAMVEALRNLLGEIMQTHNTKQVVVTMFNKPHYLEVIPNGQIRLTVGSISLMIDNVAHARTWFQRVEDAFCE